MTLDRRDAMKIIPVNEPLLSVNAKRYLAECIDTGWISSEGPLVSRFEEEFSHRVGQRFGIAVCNGSAALELAVAALDIGPGDEVIMPSFTIISCAAAVVRRGAIPVLVDCDPLTWNMNPQLIEAKITKHTRSIMVVHIYGLPVDMAPIIDIARRYGLYIIEDAAEMHGQTYRGRPCGSFGKLSTFSFYPNKLITTGEGGMVLANDEVLAERCRSLRNLCFRKERRFLHEELGWNFRMTSLQAAMGLAQLETLDAFVARKKSMGARYTHLLSDLPGLQLPLARTDYAENIYWVYGIVLDDAVPLTAAEAMARLAELHIQTRPFFWPMHEQPVFRKMGLFENDIHPVAERIARRGFYIPSGLALTPKQMERVADAIKEVLR